jgi:hypothetical protein
MESKWSRDAHIAGLTSQSSARLRDLPPGISNAFCVFRWIVNAESGRS